MKILLIQPAKAPLTVGGEDIHLYEPLALEYLAAGVATDHDVRILDMRLEPDLAPALADWAPDVVGITAYTVHAKTVRRLFDQVKAWNPRTLTVVGGHHATVVPHDFLSPAIDLIVRGEGVAAFREIVERHERGAAFDGIPGVGFARDGAWIMAETSPAVDLDAIPHPRRDLTARYRSRYFSEWMKPLASMRTSKGCPYRCSFCALWKLTGGRYLRRRPERIVEELAGIDEECIFFADDESLVDAGRMKILAQLIGNAGIRKRYFLYGGSDTITRHPDLLEMWRKVGLERVFVGLEFSSDESLRTIGKGSTTEDNARAAKILHDLGIELYATLIVRPDFGHDEFAALGRYCRELDLNFAGFAVLTPLPGTDLYEQVQEGLLTRDTDFYDLFHTVLPTALPLRDFYEEYASLFTRAIPMSRQLSLVRRYPLRQLVPVVRSARRMYGRIGKLWRDYEGMDLLGTP
jgi:hopanoid C-3 methylase